MLRHSLLSIMLIFKALHGDFIIRPKNCNYFVALSENQTSNRHFYSQLNATAPRRPKTIYKGYMCVGNIRCSRTWCSKPAQLIIYTFSNNMLLSSIYVFVLRPLYFTVYSYFRRLLLTTVYVICDNIFQSIYCGSKLHSFLLYLNFIETH